MGGDGGGGGDVVGCLRVWVVRMLSERAYILLLGCVGSLEGTYFRIGYILSSSKIGSNGDAFSEGWNTCKSVLFASEQR